jgi:hypothetical protein
MNVITRASAQLYWRSDWAATIPFTQHGLFIA